MFNFIFPLEQQLFEVIQNLSDLKQKLKSTQQSDKYMVSYRIRQRKQIYLYAQCQECNGCLYYKLSGHNYRLTKFKNSHHHKYSENRRQNKLQKLIRQLPDGIDMKNAKIIAMSQIKTTSTQFYYFYNKIKNPVLSYRQLIQKLDEQQFQIQTDPFQNNMNTLPQLMIVVSPLMKKMFKKYGEWTSFDFTFHVIKQKLGLKTFKIGAFVGLSFSKKIVPFALVISADQTKERYQQIFKSFGDIMQRMPDTIITDQGASMKAALQQLKGNRDFNGNHYLDVFHIMRNVRKRLVKKENIRYFSQLCHSQNSYEFERNVDDAYQNLLIEEIPLLKKFLDDSHRYCFSQVRSQMIGFCISSGINQKFHDLLKSRIPYQLPFTQVIRKSLKLIDQLIQKCDYFQIQKTPVQKYYATLPEIKQIRYMVDSSIFQMFCSQLSKVINLELISTTIDEFKVKDQKYSDVFCLSMRNNKLSCQCKYRQKTGIACSHIIKVMAIIKIRLSESIDQRWKILFRQQIKGGKRKGCKKTRRNK